MVSRPWQARLHHALCASFDGRDASDKVNLLPASPFPGALGRGL